MPRVAAKEKLIELPVPPSNQNIGPCVGCGQPNSALRRVTREHLCSSCRDDLRYKLITKSTVLDLYPTLTIRDLVEAVKARQVRMHFAANWYNRSAPPIKLYYEIDIQRLCQHKERHSARQSRERGHSHHSRSCSLRVVKV